ncbi:MAG: flagellar basal body P-ring formation chaperone FlgA [Pseudomonadota bacterium]
MRILFLLLAGVLAAPALADDGTHVIATRPIRSQTVLSPADVAVRAGAVPGAAAQLEAVVGLETRTTLYAGRPIHPASLGPPALVDRNDIVSLVFAGGALSIRTEARALDRAGLGERIRVMNLASRITVSGRVAGPRLVEVMP